MLPSTGYFKTINCPFYDSGLCERPYCHFKHPRRDEAAANSGLPIQAVALNQNEGIAAIDTQNSSTFQELVSQAVKKVLATQDVTETAKISDNIVSRVVEELNPASSSAVRPVIPTPQATVQPTPCVYNPTPIAELKKRHIPVVPYMPTRDSRIAVKRKTSPERFKPWLSVPQDITNSLDNALSGPSYSTGKVTEITYKPTAITNITDTTNVQGYIPTTKSDSSSSNSFEDGNSSDYIFKTKEEYWPKSKKRREEYVPKKLKVPLKIVQQLDEPDADQAVAEMGTTGEVPNTNEHNTERLENKGLEEYELEVEPQFSDEDERDKICNNSTKKTNEAEVTNSEESRRSQKSSSRSNDVKDSSRGNKTTDKTTSNVKDKEKSKEKSDKDKSSKKERSSSTSERNKDLKEVSNREKSKDKDKHRSSSSSKEKSHSSSSNKDKSRRHAREKGKSRHSDNESSRRSKESSSKSSKHKDRSVRGKSKDSHKSSSRDKHRSTSSSSSSKDKHSHKSDKSYRSSTKSSTLNKKSESRKTSGNETSSNEDHDEKENSPSIRYRPSSPFSEEILEISDSDHDIEEECLKIFQEYEVPDHPKETNVAERPKPEPQETGETGRKRVAHPSADQFCEIKRVPAKPPKIPVNPHLRLTERWRLMKEAIATANAEKTTAPTAVINASQSFSAESKKTSGGTKHTEQVVNGNGRLRIAHVPYATSLALAKQKVTQAMNKAVENKTVAQTAKGGSRVAHVPQVIPQLIRPEPLNVVTQKFPLNVRQYYVNMMQDVCVQIYTNAEDAAQRAVREEFACHERCKAVAVYKNSCMLATHRLRKELDQRSGDSGTSSASGTVSHESVLAGKSKGSWSVVKTKRSVMEFKGAILYTLLSKWILTEEQLRENGYPRPHPDGPTGRVKVYVTNTRGQTILSKVPNERFCSRCNQPYMVDKHGYATAQQNCIYHWGRKFTVKGEGRYSCCRQYGSAPGCCDAKTHVWDYVDYENLRGYVKTLPKDDLPVEEHGVYALDCEMSYTTQGLELTRVTVINEECNVVYETFVKPVHPVVDYNTRDYRTKYGRDHHYLARRSGHSLINVL
ncbi:RNA exonuclease 1 homolog isoform X2 [Athalia rosae]|uniref:RNA exonuclease 1 homolog isoform X2 n=1 Tax=Athalia rosae TaxID=37344 RepID=UPI00203330EF|nr:RNA exonuclease 1 homolog isoform X2 [Athalia rosae]